MVPPSSSFLLKRVYTTHCLVCPQIVTYSSCSVSCFSFFDISRWTRTNEIGSDWYFSHKQSVANDVFWKIEYMPNCRSSKNKNTNDRMHSSRSCSLELCCFKNRKCCVNFCRNALCAHFYEKSINLLTLPTGCSISNFYTLTG